MSKNDFLQCLRTAGVIEAESFRPFRNPTVTLSEPELPRLPALSHSHRRSRHCRAYAQGPVQRTASRHSSSLTSPGYAHTLSGHAIRAHDPDTRACVRATHPAMPDICTHMHKTHCQGQLHGPPRPLSSLGHSRTLSEHEQPVRATSTRAHVRAARPARDCSVDNLSDGNDGA